jgi:raffinose/stachyose/melibiose transport system permease protein
MAVTAITGAYSRARRWHLSRYLWVVPALLLLLFFVYYPIVDNLRLSFYSWSVFAPEPEFVGLANYERAVQDPVFWLALRNNVFYVVTSVVVQVGGGLMLAALVEGTVGRRFRSFFRSVYFIPATLSVTICAILFGFIFHDRVGFINAILRAVGLGDFARDWLGEPGTAIWTVIIMSQWQFIGYVAVLMMVAIQRIPDEQYEAAQLDGAGPLRRFFSVTVPLVREMTAVMTVFTMAGAFEVINQVLVMTGGGPNNSSQVLGTWLYDAAFSSDRMGYAAAIAVFLFVFVAITSAVQMLYTRKKRVVF